jgi:hypothetical protein
MRLAVRLTLPQSAVCGIKPGTILWNNVDVSLGAATTVGAAGAAGLTVLAASENMLYADIIPCRGSAPLLMEQEKTRRSRSSCLALRRWMKSWFARSDLGADSQTITD